MIWGPLALENGSAIWGVNPLIFWGKLVPGLILGIMSLRRKNEISFSEFQFPPYRFPVRSGEAGQRTTCNRRDDNEGNVGTNVEQGLMGFTCALYIELLAFVLLIGHFALPEKRFCTWLCGAVFGIFTLGPVSQHCPSSPPPVQAVIWLRKVRTSRARVLVVFICARLHIAVVSLLRFRGSKWIGFLGEL